MRIMVAICAIVKEIYESMYESDVASICINVRDVCTNVPMLVDSIYMGMMTFPCQGNGYVRMMTLSTARNQSDEDNDV